MRYIYFLLLYKVESRVLLTSKQFEITTIRMAHQLIEVHRDFSDSYIIGIQPRGVLLAERMGALISKILGKPIVVGKLDITLHRDDLHLQKDIIVPQRTEIDFSIEGKNVILVDDVLYTGRTIRAALDALIDVGRPNDIELMVLIDRKLHRHVPVKAKYVGMTIDSIVSEKVRVSWSNIDGKDEVVIEPKSVEN